MGGARDKLQSGIIGMALMGFLAGVLAITSPVFAAPLDAQDAPFLARINQALKALPPMSGRLLSNTPSERAGEPTGHRWGGPASSNVTGL